MYPISKYKFYVTPKNKVVAISTYAGKTVRGVAKTDPRDTFDLNFGKELAAARCNAKVAVKRRARAEKQLKVATKKLIEAQVYADKMKNYLTDAYREVDEATYRVVELENRG